MEHISDTVDYRKGILWLRKDGPVSFMGRSARAVSRRALHRTAPYATPSLVIGYFDLLSRVSANRSDANPAIERWVDPEDITAYQGSGPNKFGVVRSGDWDNPKCKIDKHPVNRSIRAHFKDDASWETTDLFNRYEERIQAGNPYWRCRTRDELYEYFAKIDQLYEAIDQGGYLSQRELLRIAPGEVRSNCTDAPHPLLHEVGVNIFRDGTLAKKGAGNHRLAIAKILKIDSIPVTVRTRHTEWQSIRDDVRSADQPSQLSPELRDLLDHPDLQDIVPEPWMNHPMVERV